MQDFIHTLPALNVLFAEITLEGTIQPFVTAIIFIGMIVALMLPILAIPYIFIKMGNVAAKIQAAGSKAVRRGARKGTGLGKQAVGNSKYGQAWKQAKGHRQAIRADRGRKFLGGHPGLVGTGMGADGKAYMDKIEKIEQKKRVNDHMTALRSEAPADLVKVFKDTGQDIDKREAAAQVLASQGHGAQLLQLSKEFGDGGTSADTAAKAAFRQATIVDNYSTVKKEAPTVVGKKYDDLTGEAILGLGTEVFNDAMTNPVARAKFAKTYADPTAQTGLKGIHDTYAAANGMSGPPSMPPPPSSPPPTPPPSSPPPTPPLPPGASGGQSGSVGPNGLWTPGP